MADQKELFAGIRKRFAEQKVTPRKGYSTFLEALRRREELLKEQAYPEPGQVLSKFKEIAGFNPKAAEELTAREYKIRGAPYEETLRYREAAESAEAKMQNELENLRTKLETQRQKELTKAESERVAGVKTRAMQEIWRQQHPEWDENRIRLELRRRNLLKHYKKPPGTASTPTTPSENIWEKIGWHPFGLGE